MSAQSDEFKRLRDACDPGPYSAKEWNGRYLVVDSEDVMAECYGKDDANLFVFSRTCTLPEELEQAEAEIKDLAMLVRRLCSAANPTPIRVQAMDYLKRKGLQGSILRDESTQHHGGR